MSLTYTFNKTSKAFKIDKQEVLITAIINSKNVKDNTEHDIEDNSKDILGYYIISPFGAGNHVTRDTMKINVVHGKVIVTLRYINPLKEKGEELIDKNFKDIMTHLLLIVGVFDSPNEQF